jgi:hypothetical protein
VKARGWERNFRRRTCERSESLTEKRPRGHADKTVAVRSNQDNVLENIARVIKGDRDRLRRCEFSQICIFRYTFHMKNVSPTELATRQKGGSD